MPLMVPKAFTFEIRQGAIDAPGFPRDAAWWRRFLPAGWVALTHWNADAVRVTTDTRVRAQGLAGWLAQNPRLAGAYRSVNADIVPHPLVHANTITWCVARNHPWVTYNPWLDQTFCRCGERMAEGRGDLDLRAIHETHHTCGWATAGRCRCYVTSDTEDPDPLNEPAPETVEPSAAGALFPAAWAA